MTDKIHPFEEAEATLRLATAMVAPVVAAANALNGHMNHYAAVKQAKHYVELHGPSLARVVEATAALDDAIASLLDKNDELLNDLYLRRKLGDDWDQEPSTDVDFIP